MIISELAVQNIGTFKGLHTIDLLPPSEDKPVILFGGLNGAGKTTLLEAIQLALYGSLFHASSRFAGSYENYLRNLIHRGSPLSEGAAVELTFSAHQEGIERTYEVRRSWKATGKSIRETLVVFTDGTYNQTLSSNWSEYVETFLPRGISELFFFDGEQIEALADLDRSRRVLRTAVTSLLGLDLVERLSTDLTALRKRYRKSQVPPELKAKIKESESNSNAALQAEKKAKDELTSIRAQLSSSNKAYEESLEDYRVAGGPLSEQREISENKVEYIRKTLIECENEIRNEISGHAPLLLVESQLADLLTEVHQESQNRENTMLVGVLANRDQKILDELSKLDLDESLTSKIEDFLSVDRESRTPDSSSCKGFNVGSASELELLINSTLPRIRTRLESLEDRRIKLLSDLEEAERMLAAIPEPESVRPVKSALDQSKHELAKYEALLALAVKNLEESTARSLKAKSTYESNLNAAAESELALEDERRLIAHIDKVKVTLENVRSEATERHLERISQLVLGSLKALLRKDDLITDLSLDPHDFTVSLTGFDGALIAPDDLSAGERQLLAVALLWGLAQASGQPLPVVIDTPLGRLDGTHRSHLVERYFPQASHQVILLSTDKEIDASTLTTLSNSIGKSYQLKFDPKSNSTNIEKGYFWEQV